jgi:endoglucanase
VFHPLNSGENCGSNPERLKRVVWSFKLLFPRAFVDHRERAEATIFLLFLFILMTRALSGQTSADSPSVAFARARYLAHGVNASNWYAQAGDYSTQRLTTYITPQDFALIRRMGFDNVRLSIDAAQLICDPGTSALNGDFLAHLDVAIHDILGHDLAVVVDIHPEKSYKHALCTDQSAVTSFLALWRALAGHYAATDPERVFFEIMNEPEIVDPGRWSDIERRAVAIIRRAAPRHTIIATGANYSGIEDLLLLEPFPDNNIVYAFHYYQPFPFTHQGAGWGRDQWKALRDIPYPSTPEAVAPKLFEEPNAAYRYYLNEYGLDRWDEGHVASEIRFAAEWGAAHHVPVWCGEFGVYRLYANPAMRARWIRDVRTALESSNIGWDMWDYCGDFGIVTKSGDSATPEVKILDALGLTCPVTRSSTLER